MLTLPVLLRLGNFLLRHHKESGSPPHRRRGRIMNAPPSARRCRRCFATGSMCAAMIAAFQFIHFFGSFPHRIEGSPVGKELSIFFMVDVNAKPGSNFIWCHADWATNRTQCWSQPVSPSRTSSTDARLRQVITRNGSDMDLAPWISDGRGPRPCIVRMCGHRPDTRSRFKNRTKEFRMSR